MSTLLTRPRIPHVISFVGRPEESLLMERINDVCGDVLDGILATLRGYAFKHSERVGIAKNHSTRRVFCKSWECSRCWALCVTAGGSHSMVFARPGKSI